jgi:hypothetical protein
MLFGKAETSREDVRGPTASLRGIQLFEGDVPLRRLDGGIIGERHKISGRSNMMRVRTIVIVSNARTGKLYL